MSEPAAMSTEAPECASPIAAAREGAWAGLRRRALVADCTIGVLAEAIGAALVVTEICYAEDKWLRLWLLGGPEHPVLRLHSDDRHRHRTKYWRFLTECWAGCEALLGDQVKVVIRIGGNDLSKEELACAACKAVYRRAFPVGP
jgi:hypothetical protein